MPRNMHQTIRDFAVGDKVVTNEYHGLFFDGRHDDEHSVVGTVIQVSREFVGVHWGRTVRYSVLVNRLYPQEECYWHNPWYLDKYNPFHLQVQSYVTRTLADG